MSERFLTTPQLMKKLGCRRTSIYRYCKSNYLPKPRKLNNSRNVWLESEIDEWMLSLKS